MSVSYAWRTSQGRSICSARARPRASCRPMTISALSIVKRPAPHCAKPAVSESGFRLAAITRLTEAILAHIQSVYTTANRSQRCFRVSSDGGQQWYGPALDAYSCDHHDRKIRPAVRKATFRANSIQVDRSQLCMPEGSNLNETSLGTVLPLTTERVARKRITKPPDLELVEHGKPLERCVRPMRSREYLLGLTTQ